MTASELYKLSIPENEAFEFSFFVEKGNLTSMLKWIFRNRINAHIKTFDSLHQVQVTEIYIEQFEEAVHETACRGVV